MNDDESRDWQEIVGISKRQLALDGPTLAKYGVKGMYPEAILAADRIVLAAREYTRTRRAREQAVWDIVINGNQYSELWIKEYCDYNALVAAVGDVSASTPSDERTGEAH